MTTIRHSWRPNRTVKHVPLWPTTPEGDLVEGRLRVPLRLCNAAPHSNERHEFDRMVGELIKRWIDWRKRRGWHVNSKPTVKGPYFIEKGYRAGETETDEQRQYIVSAYFKRESPLFLKLDDFLEQRTKAQRYGVSFDEPKLPANRLAKAVDEIVDNGPSHDPLVFAEARRQRLGIKRKDYLTGPISQPVGEDR